MPIYNTGTRVYWHGLFPKKTDTGTVVSRGGDLRTEVRWDTTPDIVTMSNNSSLMSFTAKCGCGYCTAPVSEPST